MSHRVDCPLILLSPEACLTLESRSTRLHERLRVGLMDPLPQFPVMEAGDKGISPQVIGYLRPGIGVGQPYCPFNRVSEVPQRLLRPLMFCPELRPLQRHLVGRLVTSV